MAIFDEMDALAWEPTKHPAGLPLLRVVVDETFARRMLDELNMVDVNLPGQHESVRVQEGATTTDLVNKGDHLELQRR